MTLKVAKFGGSSLADAQQVEKVRQIVSRDPEIRFVVPSAPGKRHKDDQKITDLLYLCQAAAAQQVPIKDTFERISARYFEIVKQTGAKIDLQPHLEEIGRRIEQGASQAYAASRGEYLCGLILADLLGFDFIDPAEVICFDSRGRFNPEMTQEVISVRLRKHQHAVVPGFYGSRSDGEIQTFSRGGSDITGAIVARGVGADVYENWTDVSGLLMADPAIVKNPKPITAVTYRELRELAYMGAKVLHDEAIFPVRQAGIPVNIRNTNEPDHPGTMIVQDADPNTPHGVITGIAGRKDFTVIALERALMNAELGFGRRVLSVLEVNGINFEHMPSGIDTMSLVVADSEINDKLEDILEELRSECHPDSLDVSPNMALIATVGRGMAYTPGMAARLFTALGDAKINIRMIDQGSSELNIIVGVEADHFEAAIRAIYDAFVR
jgi:aspartate kinase